MTLDSGNIRFMRIFAEVLKIYVNFPDFTPTPVYYVYAYLTLFVIKFNGFVYYSYYLTAAVGTVPRHCVRWVVKCGLAEMWQAD